MQLVIVPAAGSMGYEYNRWKTIIDNKVKMNIIVYPGHGSRISETYAETWDALVEDLYKNILAVIKEEKYILFGHSMGGTIIYEVYRRMVDRGDKLPETICFAGCEPPMLIGKSVKSNLPEDLFRNYFIEMGGINLEILQYDELADLLFQTLRSDTKLLESYVYSKSEIRFDSNVIIMNGKEDRIDNQKILWEKATKYNLEYYEFDGGHFFIFEQIEQVLSALLSKDILLEYAMMIPY